MIRMTSALIATVSLGIGPSLLQDCGDEPTPGDEPLVLSNPQSEVPGDFGGQWNAGEDLIITVTLSNVSGEDLFNYPGAVVSTSDPDAVMVFDADYVYGLLDGESANLSFQARAKDNAFAGPVTFTADVDALSCTSDCPPSNPISFTVYID